MSENRCVCCGESVPEGRMVCPVCENKVRRNRNMNDKQMDRVLELVGIVLGDYLADELVDDLVIAIGEKLQEHGEELEALSGEDARAALGIVDTEVDEVDE